MKQKSNGKLFIVVVALAVMIAMNLPRADNTQSVAPSCFTKEDCRVPIADGYCGVKYDCEMGKCVSSFDPCPKVCSGSCSDPLCWKTEMCHCMRAGWTQCLSHSCYCPMETESRWLIIDGQGACRCI